MQKVLDALFALRDEGYRDFISNLSPTVDKENIIGVRTPAMRKYAKQFSSDPDARAFLKELPHRYYEENNLHAALINLLFRDIDSLLEQIEHFLPYVDNWATCDTLGPKLFNKHPEKVYERIEKWIRSDKTYTVRFAVVTLLDFYLDGNFTEDSLLLAASVRSDEYYINMAVAWYMSFALIKQYDSAIKLFETPTLGKWVHNKSIQKAIESYRISDETKAYLRTLKIK